MRRTLEEAIRFLDERKLALARGTGQDDDPYAHGVMADTPDRLATVYAGLGFDAVAAADDVADGLGYILVVGLTRGIDPRSVATGLYIDGVAAGLLMAGVDLEEGER